MAGIIQAAQWLMDGYVVYRVSEDADSMVRYKYDYGWFIAYGSDSEFEEGMITLSDILAEDWELMRSERE